MQIAGSTAFITGGASGLGAATARHLASLGAQVGVLDRDGERGAAIASEIGGVFAECDVSSAESLEAAFAHLQRPPSAAPLFEDSFMGRAARHKDSFMGPSS